MDMDGKMSWADMQTQAEDRDKWRGKVAEMRAKERGETWDTSKVTVKQKRATRGEDKK